MRKTVACIIARTVSTRLPLKVLRTVYNNFTLLDFIILRLKLVSEIDEIFICTSKENADDILEDVAKKNQISIYRGSADAVIERMLSVAELTKADNVIRITGDNVFTSYEYLGSQINFLNKKSLDYCRLIHLPIGATPEVINVNALKRCYRSIDPSVSEYLLLFIFNPDKYKCGVIKVDEEDFSNMTVTVDTPSDLERTKQILLAFQGDKLQISILDIIKMVKQSNIKNAYIKSKGEIKLPYDKTMSFADFQKDMDERISKSLLLRIDE